MKWAADENVDEQIVVALRAQGHDVWSVAEQDGGLEDEAILAEALVRQAVLITGDKDFGEIVFRQRRTSFGVVLIRLPGLHVDTRAARVVAVLESVRDEVVGNFTVVDATGVRVRRP